MTVVMLREATELPIVDEDGKTVGKRTMTNVFDGTQVRGRHMGTLPLHTGWCRTFRRKKAPGLDIFCSAELCFEPQDEHGRYVSIYFSGKSVGTKKNSEKMLAALPTSALATSREASVFSSILSWVTCVLITNGFYVTD